MYKLMEHYGKITLEQTLHLLSKIIARENQIMMIKRWIMSLTDSLLAF